MSSFFKAFYPNASRREQIELLEEAYESTFDMWKKKYVTDNDNVKYEKAYQPSSINLKYIIDDYVDSVAPLRKLKGNATPFTEEELQKLEYFFELNNWDDTIKQWLKNRKLYGDSYTVITLKNNNQHGYIPFLKNISAKYIEIVDNPNSKVESSTFYATDNDFEKEYIFKTTKEYTIRQEGRIDTTTETKDVAIVFSKGMVIPYVNGAEQTEDIIKYIGTPLDDTNPMIHLQFMKELESPYSKIPAKDFIDDIIRLDRIETDISEANHMSSAPQVYVTDGNIDEKSEFGARAIAYCDTLPQALAKGKQAQIKQLEITNGLDSLFMEQERTINTLCDKANLIPPSIKMILAKSNSGKVQRYFSQDLLTEIKKGYEEISNKTKILWKILFPNRANEDISLFIPSDIYASTLYDQASYVAAKIKTIRDVKRQEGFTEAEIDRYLDDLKFENDLLSGKLSIKETDVTSNDVEKASADGEKVTVRDNDEDNPKNSVEGIDNRIKN